MAVVKRLFSVPERIWRYTVPRSVPFRSDLIETPSRRTIKPNPSSFRERENVPGRQLLHRIIMRCEGFRYKINSKLPACLAGIQARSFSRATPVAVSKIRTARERSLAREGSPL